MTELARIEPSGQIQQVNVGSLLDAIVSKGVTSESAAAVKDLVMLHEHCQERDAKLKFMRALFRVKSRTRTINATKGIPAKDGSIKWYYAPYEDLLDEIEPILQNENMYVRFDSRREGAILNVTCWLCSSESGFEIKSDCSINVSGSEGGDLGALKKGKRGAITSMFSLKTRHISEDARIMGDVISNEQAKSLRERALKLGRDERAFLRFGKVIVPLDRVPCDDDYRLIRSGIYAQIDMALRKLEREKQNIVASNESVSNPSDASVVSGAATSKIGAGLNADAGSLPETSAQSPISPPCTGADIGSSAPVAGEIPVPKRHEAKYRAAVAWSTQTPKDSIMSKLKTACVGSARLKQVITKAKEEAQFSGLISEADEKTLRKVALWFSYFDQVM